MKIRALPFPAHSHEYSSLSEEWLNVRLVSFSFRFKKRGYLLRDSGFAPEVLHYFLILHQLMTTCVKS